MKESTGISKEEACGEREELTRTILLLQAWMVIKLNSVALHGNPGEAQDCRNHIAISEILQQIKDPLVSTEKFPNSLIRAFNNTMVSVR